MPRYVREERIAERPREGPKHVRVDNEMTGCLNEISNENCLLRLTQLKQELRQSLPRKPRIYDRNVARTLKGMLFRIKLAVSVPAERNRPDVIQKRLDNTNWFMGHAVVNHSVLINERMVVIIQLGLQEVTVEQEEGNGNVDKFLVSEEEMSLSKWPFH